MKNVTKILTTTVAAAALALGGLVAPASAAAPITGIDLNAVPAQINYGAGCNDYAFTVTFSGGDAQTYPTLSASLTGNTNSSDNLFSVSNNTQQGLRNVAGVPQSLSAFICDSLANPGPQTLTVTVKAYGFPDVVAQKAVHLKATDSGLAITGVSGKLKASATKKVTGSTTKSAIGRTAKLYYKKSGAKKYKYIGKAKIKSSTYGGKFTIKSKKLGTGKIYVKFKGNANVKGQKSANIKVVKRSF